MSDEKSDTPPIKEQEMEALIMAAGPFFDMMQKNGDANLAKMTIGYEGAPAGGMIVLVRKPEMVKAFIALLESAEDVGENFTTVGEVVNFLNAAKAMREAP